MNMDERIRVRTARNHERFYNDMKDVAVTEFHELFYVAACLGYNRGRKKSIEQARDGFWSSTITQDEWCTYYSMILASNAMDFSKIEDAKAVIREIEQYANAGIDVLVEELLSSCINEKDGEIGIERSSHQELPKLLLNYVLEQGLAATDEMSA